MVIKINNKTLEVFRACERGAHEDDIRGPSPLTTVEILARSEYEIVVDTPEEAAQIADCCEYGTFPLFCPNIAKRVQREALSMPRALEVMRRWQHEEMNALVERVLDVTNESSSS